MENFVWSGVILAVLLIVALAQIPLSRTKRVKTKLFQLNILLAALSYFGLLILLPFIYNLFQKDDFVRFHLKQGLVLFILLLIIVLITKYIQTLGIVLFIVFGSIAIFAMIQASHGYFWQLPLIGKKLT